MRTFFAFAFALVLVGCDSDRPVETVVYGTVLDAQTGAPLPGIPYQLYVVLSGPGSFQSLDKGVTDADGRFTARTAFYASSQSGVSIGINSTEHSNDQYLVQRTGVRYGTHTLTFRLEPQ